MGINARGLLLVVVIGVWIGAAILLLNGLRTAANGVLERSKVSIESVRVR